MLVRGDDNTFSGRFEDSEEVRGEEAWVSPETLNLHCMGAAVSRSLTLKT
jgi:hypothetical protein